MAISELLDMTNPYVLRICRGIAGDTGEDAAQEALTIAFRRLGRLRNPSALRGWLRTIAVREALRAASPNAPGMAAEGREPRAPGPDPELHASLHDQLARLPPDQRAVLVMRDLEGFSEEEAAAALDVAVGTVKSRLNRARSRFQAGWST
jgi:RNA polymerase sigma-70 factor (ECF subfamily)